MGGTPELVDFALRTHLHLDQVGWNTPLDNGRWVPTFPNARYLFRTDEYAHWQANEMLNVGSGTTECSFEDSALPVVDAGLAWTVDGDHAIEEGVFLKASLGHTPGHVCLHLESGGKHALCARDNTRYCHDPVLSRATRQSYVERYADTVTQILAGHFLQPVAGRFVWNGAPCMFAV